MRIQTVSAVGCAQPIKFLENWSDGYSRTSLVDHRKLRKIYFLWILQTAADMTFFESDDNAQYAEPNWWESEYQKCKPGDSYEWFIGDNQLLQRLISLIPPSTQTVLNLGCGISHVQDAIYDAGFHDITNVDVSATCIGLMSASDTRGMKWQIANLMEPFPFASGSFDFALDKGTLDALIVDRADKWEPEDEVYETAAQYFREIARVLRPGGVFVQISFGQPHFRRRLFERDEFNWKVEVHTLAPTHSFHFFMYECRKK
jgi:SAM-dependent methyltransferase